MGHADDGDFVACRRSDIDRLTGEIFLRSCSGADGGRRRRTGRRRRAGGGRLRCGGAISPGASTSPDQEERYGEDQRSMGGSGSCAQTTTPLVLFDTLSNCGRPRAIIESFGKPVTGRIVSRS